MDSKIKDTILDKLSDKPLSIFILLAAIYYFYSSQTQLRTQLFVLQEQVYNCQKESFDLILNKLEMNIQAQIELKHSIERLIDQRK